MGRSDIVESIEIALVELRGVAQPHEVASFHELSLDAAEADSDEQLAAIAAQVESLREFCERRNLSNPGTRLDQLPRGRFRLG
jgi:hypothetical protein